MKLHDAVVTKRALPEDGVAEGQVGTIIDLLDESTVLVEFDNPDGVAFAIASIPRADLIVLQYTPTFSTPK